MEQNQEQDPKPQNKNTKYIVIVAAAAILFFALYYVFRDIPEEIEEHDAQEPQETRIPEEGISEQETEALEAERNTPGQFVLTGLSLAECEAAAEDIAKAAQTYYDKYSEQAEMVSRSGYFFDVPADSYVKPIDLYELTDLKEAYKDFDIPILWIHPSDIEKNGEEGLSFYAVCATEQEYVVYSPKGKVGVLTEKEINEVLAKYNASHGAVTRYGKEHSEYRQALKTIQDIRGDESDLDVRYLAGDEKYILAYVSPVSNSLEIEGYLLIKNGKSYEALDSGFSSTYQSQSRMTQKAPDLNPEIFPESDLYYQGKYLKDDFGMVVLAMLGNGLIEESDGTPVFVSGDDRFVYMTFENGKKFVGGLNEEDTWVLFPVNSYLEAEDFLKSQSQDPPLFIIKQE